MAKAKVEQQVENKAVEQVVVVPEYKTEDNKGYRFMFNGNWVEDNKAYERRFKKADKAGMFKRPITSSYPNFDKADKEQTIECKVDDKVFTVTEHKYGNKSVMFVDKDGEQWLRYVSKKVVISMMADETTKSWNWIDQHIKGKLGLKVTSGKGGRSKEVAEL